MTLFSWVTTESIPKPVYQIMQTLLNSRAIYRDIHKQIHSLAWICVEICYIAWNQYACVSVHISVTIMHSRELIKIGLGGIQIAVKKIRNGFRSWRCKHFIPFSWTSLTSDLVKYLYITKILILDTQIHTRSRTHTHTHTHTHTYIYIYIYIYMAGECLFGYFYSLI